MREDNAMRYVLGFLFTEYGGRVLLIRKIKPGWQAWKWNGIGGKVEPNEGDGDAMIRECAEETGLDVAKWRPIGILSCGTHSTVSVYAARLPEDQGWRVEPGVEQELELQRVNDLHDVIPNLRWLVPLCLDEHVKYAAVDEHDRTGGG